MPFELVQVTAAYSNAVLVAIMPHISDFSKKLDLPIPQPVTIAQVRKFGCTPRADHVGGRVILTNGYSFTFDQGAVVLYRSPHSYFSLQDPERLPEFYGTVKVKKDEAISIAHNAIKNVGYTDSELHLELKPKVTPPKRNEGKEIARYLVEWIDPEQVTAGGIPIERAAVEIDASSGTIEMLAIQAREARRADPKIGIKPQVIAKQPQSEPVGGTKTYPISAEYAKSFLGAILPQLSEFGEKSGADVRTPITLQDVDMRHYICNWEETKCVSVFLYLKTGDRFVYRHGQVIAFESHDSCRIPEPNKLLEDKPPERFFGPVKVSSKEALSVATRAICQLGYGTLIPQLKQQPEVVPPRKYGTNYFARYFFNWWPKGDDMQNAVAEVDATSGKLKSFYINDRAFPKIWRDPPQIGVPLVIETNTVPATPSQPATLLPLPSLPTIK